MIWATLNLPFRRILMSGSHIRNRLGFIEYALVIMFYISIAEN